MAVTYIITKSEALRAAAQENGILAMPYDPDEAWAQHRKETLEQLAESRKALKLQRKEQQAAIRLAAKLAEAGFHVQPPGRWSLCRLYLKIEARELPRLYRTVGKLVPCGKDLCDARKRLIGVNLKTERYGDLLTITYTKRLEPGMRCKIVTQRRTSAAYKTLVCANGDS